MVDTRLIDLGGLQALIDALRSRGYTVIGPTVRSGAIVNAPISGLDDLPRGWGDEQDAAHYRLRRRDDDRSSGSPPALSPRSRCSSRPTSCCGAPGAPPTARVCRPARSRRRRTRCGGRAAVHALIGVRSCDLSAVGIHDTVLAGRGFVDAHYAGRRAERSSSPSPARTRAAPASACRWRPARNPRVAGAHRSTFLTELRRRRRPPFRRRGREERGAAVLDEIVAAPAARGPRGGGPRHRAGHPADGTQTSTPTGSRTCSTPASTVPVGRRGLAVPVLHQLHDGLPDLFLHLGRGRHRPHRQHGRPPPRVGLLLQRGLLLHPRRHGAESTWSRYRQWMTHKLASWHDQFGSSGCVGCGRCVTWCPAAIDITAEAAALRGAPGSNLPEHDPRARAPAHAEPPTRHPAE